ncbi:Atypical/RIO/RIO2 protein kinase [Phytophthora nicotianae P10297]|uniref:Serine/threonine-protein kinase RIO2 n=3 Tax=Phytophthora nicotianae TaxID=4792 RepID=W2Z3Q6_PHYNI|nr:Atypical/RIO/RIO2 protein kinase [Phytophthora nicotianae]ETO72388.1 Atypical/RIO/RIO2 protein kinase [Phytophthora nicotianae P1976]ETP41596.1 Atypical/RIO/RIO2 protein kinase [Phytophthora nicotianae P10297]
MKLDVTAMRYLTKEHFRVLTAIEMGMKNHEVVPVELITSIAKLRHGGVQKILSHLLRNKLIAHDGNAYDGFRLTYNGYDYLALRVFLQRGHITGLGRQIGVGKESDIYLATQEDGTEVAIKFHRLGRTSFRAVKSKRDYLKNRKSVSWFYMSRLSAMKEYAFLKALYDRDFPTPTPIDCNRHAICMSLVDGYPLNQVRRLANSKDAYDTAMSIVVRLAEYGLVHCDFNEFNIMIGDDGKITMIDFPQMISTSHPNAAELFDRDVHGLVKFFSRLQGGAYTPDRVPKLKDIVADENVRLDEDVEASGFGKEFGEKVHDLSIFSAHQNVEESDSDDDNEDESEEESEGEEEDGDAEVPDLVQGVEATTLDDQADGSEEEISGEVDDEEAQDSFAVENEIIKQRVQRDRQARQKAGGKRRSRNSAKLSIKGKLYHKNDW